MEKIITLCLGSKDRTRSFEDLKSQLNIDVEQCKLLIANYEDFFQITHNQITYIPPRQIVDKASLQRAIQDAFPRGISEREINACYQFVNIDIHVLQSQQLVYTHTFGKKKQKVYFAPCTPPTCHLGDIWKASRY